MEQCRKSLQRIQKKGIQTYFPKVVKSFRNVATQTDNNFAINILNSKKVHPEDMNILELDHIEDHKYWTPLSFVCVVIVTCEVISPLRAFSSSIHVSILQSQWRYRQVTLKLFLKDIKHEGYLLVLK